MRNFFILLGLLLVACGGGGETPVLSTAEVAVSTPKSDSITCTAAYRASTSQPIEREESITFDSSDSEQSITFSDLIFHAAYDAGELNNERAMRLWVTDTGETTIYQTQLYQLERNSGPQNQFVGGHGFTGLNYSYHPTTAAELQFWCQAE